MNLSANKMNVTPLAKAMKLLARRDHSVRELQQKLKPYYPTHEIASVIERCLQDNWLNDARFAESYIRSRSASGYGPLRLALELQQKGVEKETIRCALHEAQIDWRALLCRLIERRKPIADDLVTRYKLQNALQRRGFSLDLIQRCLPTPEI
jgi:regulatory protein